MISIFRVTLLLLIISYKADAASTPPTYTLIFSPTTVDWLLETLIDHPFKYKEIAPVLQAIQQSINQQNSEFVRKQRADLCELEQLPASESCGE